MGRETYHEYEERERHEEEFNDYVERRARHLPVILDSDDVDIPWLEDKTEGIEEVT